jgi:hypothetical protein
LLKLSTQVYTYFQVIDPPTGFLELALWKSKFENGMTTFSEYEPHTWSETMIED